MEFNKDVYETLEKHALDILKLTTGHQTIEDRITLVENQMTKMDTSINDLESKIDALINYTASKSDISDLRDDIKEFTDSYHNDQVVRLKEAYNAIPTWLGIILTGGILVIGLVSLAVAWIK